MAEVNFVDGLEYCNVHGHEMIEYKGTNDKIQHLKIKFERCKNCSYKVKHSCYKWHGWKSEVILDGHNDCLHKVTMCDKFNCPCKCLQCVKDTVNTAKNILEDRSYER